jgi:hypothetical protein
VTVRADEQRFGRDFKHEICDNCIVQLGKMHWTLGCVCGIGKRCRRVSTAPRSDCWISRRVGQDEGERCDAAVAVPKLYPQVLPSQGTRTIGGNLSTNAGGTACDSQIRRFDFGRTRQWRCEARLVALGEGPGVARPHVNLSTCSTSTIPSIPERSFSGGSGMLRTKQ